MATRHQSIAPKAAKAAKAARCSPRPTRIAAEGKNTVLTAHQQDLHGPP